MSVSYTPPFNLQNNTTADATQVMANFNAITTSLQNAAASGVNSDITALTALAVPITPAQGGTTLYVGGTSTGSANAQVLTPVVPAGFSLVNGNQVLFLAGFANTGAATINVAGSGALAIKIQTPSGDQALVGGEILSGQWNMLVYHSADNSFHLFGVSSQLGGIGLVTSLVSTGTVDLSLAVNHNASITGTTTITSFGSNADENFPLYRIGFTGILTLTYNATSLILPGAANITTAANDSGWALYLGAGNWQVIQYTRANGTAVVTPTPNAGFNRLTITNNSGTPNTNIDVTAASGVVLNGTVPFYASTISFTINTTTGTVTSTANGMDGEARPTSGWVYLYMISNGTAMAGLGSTSASAPTLPAGYAYSAYMGAMRTDSAGNFLRSFQRGNEIEWKPDNSTNNTAYPVIFSGTGPGVNGWTTQSVTSVVPTTATKIRGGLSVAGVTTSAVAVTGNPFPTSSNVAAVQGGSIAVATGQTTFNNTASFDIVFGASQAIYWAGTATAVVVYATGYKDSVNAN
jgi:hypothetical protein